MELAENYLVENDLAFTAAREGLALSPYRDTANLAVGIGMNKPGLREGDDVTYDQAITEFVEASKDYSRSISTIFAGVPLLQHHRGALFSAIFNVGATRLGKEEKLIEAIQVFCAAPIATPDEIVASRKLRDQVGHLFDFVGQKEDGSFHNLSRRKLEAVLFMSGNYGDLRFLPFWPRGTSPRAVPPDKPYLLKMPTFFKGAAQ